MHFVAILGVTALLIYQTFLFNEDIKSRCEFLLDVGADCLSEDEKAYLRKCIMLPYHYDNASINLLQNKVRLFSMKQTKEVV